MVAQSRVSRSEPGEKGIHVAVEGVSLVGCHSVRTVRRVSMWGQPMTVSFLECGEEGAQAA